MTLKLLNDNIPSSEFSPLLIYSKKLRFMFGLRQNLAARIFWLHNIEIPSWSSTEVSSFLFLIKLVQFKFSGLPLSSTTMVLKSLDYKGWKNVTAVSNVLYNPLPIGDFISKARPFGVITYFMSDI
jgi:hypothetical protein